MKRLIVIAALCVGSVTGFATMAQPVQAWHAHDLNGQCGYSHLYHDTGVTSVYIEQNSEIPPNLLIFSIRNNNWSVAVGDVIEEEVTIKSEHFAMQGHAVPGQHMIAVFLGEDVLNTFAKSDPQTVDIRRGNQVLARLSFTGFKAGWVNFSECFTKGSAARANRDQHYREDNQDVPVDPFASPPLSPAAKPAQLPPPGT